MLTEKDINFLQFIKLLKQFARFSRNRYKFIQTYRHDNYMMSYVSLMEWGDVLFFSSVVCLSVRLSVRPSVCLSHFRVRSISFESLMGCFKTLHKCQIWLDNVQCLCLTKVGSRSRSQFRIKHCMTEIRRRTAFF